MPSAELIQQSLNWAQMVPLWGSLGLRALLAGAAICGLARGRDNYGGAHREKSLALGAVVSALVAGLARPTAILLLFDAASS